MRSTMNIKKADISKIEEGLFLSSRSAAEAENVLERFAITDVLTIDTWPLRKEAYNKPENYVFHYLGKNDDESVDLLSHFEQCNRIINEGRNVLVHCFVGVSRSATIVLAYLMSKHQLNYEEALRRVESSRAVSPNEGFVYQLKLYEQMNYKINHRNQSYQLFMLSTMAFDVGYSVGFENLPEESRENVLSVLTDNTMDIFCRYCRCPLTSSVGIIPHFEGKPISWRSLLLVAQREEPQEPTATKRCTREVFALPTRSLMSKCHSTAGKILCPKCTRKVGRFGWLGIYCDCGAEMKPGFMLTNSRIDQPTRDLRTSECNATPYIK